MGEIHKKATITRKLHSLHLSPAHAISATRAHNLMCSREELMAKAAFII